MKKTLLILMTLCISTLCYSQTFSVTDTYGNSLRYSVISTNTVTITTGSTINNINVDIPASVSNGGTTYNVTEIGLLSFGSTAVSNVIFPNTLTSIGESAFANTNLTSVVLPSSLVTIGNFAFQNNQLTEVIISSNVTNIGIGAFRNNNSLTTVTCLAAVPPTITTANNLNDTFYDGFTGDRSDIDLIIPSGTTGAYVTDSGALWTGFNSVTEILEVGDTFVVDFITYEVTSLNPDLVRVIDYDVAGGTIVDIPATVPYSITTYDVTNINSNAFNSKGLTSVVISDNVTSIGSQAFVNNSLMSATIGNSVVTIGDSAFDSNNLTSIIIPDSVTTIEARAFDDNQITSVVIGNSVTTIGFGAFRANSLTSVTSLAAVPPTIVTSSSFPSITDSFSNDRSNINLILTGNTTDEYVTDNGALWTGFKMVFEASSATEIKVTDYEAANGTDVIIPATITIPSFAVFNVTEIKDSAFYDKGLTSVTIPDNVTAIGISAFELNSLTTVTIPDNVTVIGTTAFATNSIANLSLGNNVEIIGIGAFVNNDLTDITIPSSVTNIGLLAFGNNPLLASVTSLAVVPPIITTGTNDTFIFNRSNTALHIPAGTLDVYVTDSGALWTGFNPVTEDVSLGTSNFELAHDIRIISFTDKIEVRHSNKLRLQNYKVYSISGAKVKVGTENIISTNTLSKGIYILKLDFDKGTVVKKFAK